MAPVKISSYLPTMPQVSREAIAVIAATVISAWVISRIPAVRDLVRNNSIN